MKHCSLIMRPLAICAVLLGAVCIAMGCTSAIAGREASASGRTLLWKHRDSGYPDNVIARVEPTDSTMAYVALFNACDTARREAWIGFNSAGFAVMNTASYNLAPDTARIKDREGLIMSQALATCRSVTDFVAMLDELIATGVPMGVQANFGVTDAQGNCAYIEASDHEYSLFPIEAEAQPLIIRTNYSVSGGGHKRLGEMRYRNACHLLLPHVADKSLTPRLLCDTVSRSFYHDQKGYELNKRSAILADTGELIPRRSSCASVVIEGAPQGAPDPGAETVMWVVLGNPLCADSAVAVTLTDIPTELMAADDGLAPACSRANQLRSKVFHDNKIDLRRLPSRGK